MNRTHMETTAPVNYFDGSTLNAATHSVEQLSRQVASRLADLAAFLDPFGGEVSNKNDGPRPVEDDYPKYRLHRTIDNLKLANEKLDIIEKYINPPTETSGQNGSMNGSMATLNPDNSITLSMNEFRALLRKEIQSMPRGFPGTGPYAGKNKPKSAATKTTAKKANKKAPAKAKAKAASKKAKSKSKK